MLQSLKGLYHFFVAVFAATWFRFPSRKLTVIGVTGTDGKTTTTTIIYEILKTAGFKASMITSVHAVIAGKSYDTGFHVTTPNAYWVQKYLREAVDHGDTHFVLEVTSHALSQYRVMGVNFDIGVLTNVTHEHLDWHKTFENYLETKLTLLYRSKVAVLNRDDNDVYTRALLRLQFRKFITYGIRREAKITPVSFPFKTKLPGEYNKYNCLAAIAAASSLKINKNKILSAIAKFPGVPGRMEVLIRKPFKVIVDFAHTPNAIEQVLRTVQPETRGRLIHVFGSAGLRDHTKRPLMGEASARFADIIILTEEDYRTENVEEIMNDIAKSIPLTKQVYRFPIRNDAIEFALKEAKSGDLVIITGKGHEQSLARGTVEYPWSDQKAVFKILRYFKIKYA